MGIFDFLKKNKTVEENLENEVNEQVVEETVEELNSAETISEDIIEESTSVETIEEEPIAEPTPVEIIEEESIAEPTPVETIAEEPVTEPSPVETIEEEPITEEPFTEPTPVETIEEEPVEEQPQETVVEKPTKESLFSKMKKGLQKTKNNLTSSLDNVFSAFKSIDDDFFDELEETLILSDLGARTSMDIIETLRDKVKEQKIKETSEAKQILIDIISEILSKDETPLEIKSPTVVLIIGVNGVGKTTSIGKLANLYKSEGKSVLLAAGDTFRAAAIEQLEEWGKRSDIPVIKHAENTDSSAVIYDAIKSSQSKNVDVLICDTAGRLHNKKNLMAELEKINRVIGKEYPEANLETFLVLDGTAGQNALEQAKQFNEVCDITGLILTKLDGTAKGGIVIAIKNELNIPVRYIGVGEQINDLQDFDSKMFSNALFESDEN